MNSIKAASHNGKLARPWRIFNQADKFPLDIKKTKAHRTEDDAENQLDLFFDGQRPGRLLRETWPGAECSRCRFGKGVLRKFFFGLKSSESMR